MDNNAKFVIKTLVLRHLYKNDINGHNDLK